MDNKTKMAIAMTGIRTIIEKYDLAAVVVLHTPGLHEYFIKIDPTYSAAKFEDGKIKMELNPPNFGFDINKQIAAGKNTSNMFMHLSKRTGDIAMNLLDASMAVDKRLDAHHGDFKETD